MIKGQVTHRRNMTPQTLKAARAGLGWTQQDLATAAGIHTKTVAYYEQTERPQLGRTPDRIQAALSAQGVQIIDRTVHFQHTPTE